MLDGLDQVDWKKVRGNSWGSGSEIAEHVRRLAEPEGDASDLEMMLAEDGKLSPAAEVALPFVVELLEHPEANRRDALGVLEALLCPDVHPWATVGLDPAEPRGKTTLRNKRFRAVYVALEAAIPQIVQCLDDSDAATRVQAAELLGGFGRQSDAVVDPVLERLQSETDASVRRALLVCLGYHRLYLLSPHAKGRDRDRVAALQEALDEALADPATTRHAAVALALGPEPVPPEGFEALRMALEVRLATGRYGDGSGEGRDHLAESLFPCLPPPQDEDVIEAQSALFDRARGRAAEELAVELLGVAYGALPSDRPGRPAWEATRPIEADHPTARQRAVLARIASRPGPFGRALQERLGFLGLPTDRAAVAALGGTEVEPDPGPDALTEDLAALRDYEGVEVRLDLNLNRVRIAAVERLAQEGIDTVDRGDLHSVLASLCRMRMTTKSLDARRDDALRSLFDRLPDAEREKIEAFLRGPCGWTGS